ncbi:SecC motif-containing protein [Mycolicibacterium chubuense]|uniref:YchJ family protein n=1 Tax=Mycolicibacterium chubuense TaxID=1800 RepID=UPI000D82C2C1|nr:YchJ family metal-binding protein [Mycolicibacterium chubuense]SPX95292.1 SecC motif-containing protein [Mycolicibacterium chubuense]
MVHSADRPGASPDEPCPCGSAAAAAQCCLPLVRGERQAGTAEELMCSRYTAFALGDADHLWRTWHPRTRPEQVTIDPGVVWTGLEIIEAAPDEVEFRASYADSQRTGTLHERSRFAVRARRWFYVDGDVFE